jgi:D-glycero-D-manno-heptose 1,7-bisphosphate phosphatase
MTRPAVFLDKDGTVVENVPFNVDPARIRLAPGAADGLRRLHESGYALFVITNQGGVALGHFEEAALAGVQAQLESLVQAGGAELAGMYYCPHHPDGVVAGYTRLCVCRKPAPGLLQRAAQEHGIDLASSWMVGDILDDVEAGNRAGCRTVLIDNGNETVWLQGEHRHPLHRASDLSAAADLILGASAREAAA